MKAGRRPASGLSGVSRAIRGALVVVVLGVLVGGAVWASVVAGHAPAVQPGSITYAADHFERGAANGWGSAPVGGAYSVSGGSAADYAVGDRAGTMTETAGGSSRLASLPDVSARDVDIMLRVGTNKMAAGGDQSVYVLARRAAGATEYRGRVRFSPSGAVTEQVIQTDASVETALGAEITVPGLTYAPGKYIRVRMQVAGAFPTTLRMKAWADGQPEPAGWQVNTANSDADLQAAGMVGLRAYVSSSSTSTPVVFSFADWQVSSVGPPPDLVWKPYLQQLADTSVILLWSTRGGPNPVVRYSTDASYSTSIRGSTRTLSDLGIELHRVALTGLQPNTTYHYKIYTGDKDLLPSESLSFQTAPLVGSPIPFTFVAFGDYGSNSVTQRRLRDQMARDAFRFIVTTGDNAYDKGNYGDWNANVFQIYGDLFDRVGFFPSVGNHDYGTRAAAAFLDLFDLPWAVSAAGKHAHYYSFDYGNAHFVMLDTDVWDTPDRPAVDAMLGWLRNDLSRTTQQWKIVAFHYPAYSTGVHGSDLRVQHELVPIFEAYRVDLVLNGHDHLYERTLPLRGSQVTTVDQGGIVYVVTGAGDAVNSSCRSADWVAVAYCAPSSSFYSRISVDGDRLTVEAIDGQGAVRDQVSWTKGTRGLDMSAPVH